jgi:putative ATP-dependent endonuclease of OLD family
MSFNGTRIADRLVVITDGDKTLSDEGEILPGLRRKSALDALAAANGAKEILDVFVNTYSLESELVAAGNDAMMKEVYVKLHQQSEEKWNDAVSLTRDASAKSIQDLFVATRKGDFAQLLGEKIDCGGAFFVPEYIRLAIEALVR